MTCGGDDNLGFGPSVSQEKADGMLDRLLSHWLFTSNARNSLKMQ
jgi:hypothetical protein